MQSRFLCTKMLISDRLLEKLGNVRVTAGRESVDVAVAVSQTVTVGVSSATARAPLASWPETESEDECRVSKERW